MQQCYVRYFSQIEDQKSVLLVEAPRRGEYLLDTVVAIVDQLGFGARELARTERNGRFSGKFALTDSQEQPLAPPRGPEVARALAERLNPSSAQRSATSWDPPRDSHPTRAA